MILEISGFQDFRISGFEDFRNENFRFKNFGICRSAGQFSNLEILKS